MARLVQLARLLVPAAVVTLVVAASAHGASTVTLSGGVATYTAGAGEVNELTVRIDSGTSEVVFTDAAQTINEGSPNCTGNGTGTVRCADASVSSIVVDLSGEDDELHIESTGNNPVTSADMGAGDDSITLGTSSAPITLDGITSAVTLDGGDGTDSLTVRDVQDSADDTVRLTSSSIGDGALDNFFGGGGSATHSNLESVQVEAGVGASNVSIMSTAAGTSTTFDGGAGGDIIKVSSDGTGLSGDLDQLLGPLTILGGSGANSLQVSDADAVAANVGTVNATSLSGFAPVSLDYSASGTWAGGLIIRASNLADTIAVASTVAGATTEVRALGGDDTIRVSSDGSGATGNLAAIAGDLTIDSGPGANTVAISDLAEATPGANAAVTVSSSAIAGLAGPGDLSSIALAATGGSFATLSVTGSDSGSLSESYTVSDVPGPFTLSTAAGNDTATLESAAHASTINAGAGDDTLRVGSAVAGLGGVSAPITVDGGAGADNLTIDDAADPSADVVGLNANSVGADPGNSLFSGGGSLTHAGLESLSLMLGGGSDAVTIAATGAGLSTALNTGGGDDIVSIPGAGANLDTIVSPLTLDGGPGFNMLLLDDSADPTADVVTMSESAIGQASGDSLFGPGGSLGHSGFTLVTLTLGSGGDHLLLSGSPAGTLATGDGDDTVELADLATLTGTIDAGDGVDTLSYASVASSVSVDLGIGAAHGTSGVQSFENVIGGHGPDELTGLSETPSELDGGAGNDSLMSGSANDRLTGGKGNDILDGGKGNDTYVLGAGRDRVIDAGGKDTLDFSAASRGIKVDLAKTGKKFRRLGKGVGWLRLQAAIENVIGSRHKDRIVGNLLRNVLKGGAGNDALTGSAGNDTLIGGAGIDRVVEAADKHFKLTQKRLRGRGIDKLRSIERATINGGRSANRINASAFKGRVILRGGAGDDTITGGRGKDLLLGEDGNDQLTGGKGKDQLSAGPGNDLLFVRDGSVDIVDGGIGWDQASSDARDRSSSVEYQRP